MVELFTKEGDSIMTFKKGEIIMRIQPLNRTYISFNENLQINQNFDIKDRSYINTPYEFLGIENNFIYLEEAHPLSDKRISMELEEGFDGWVNFEPLPGLTLLETLDIHFPSANYLHDLKQKLNNKPISEPTKSKNYVRRYWLLLLRYIGYRK